MQRLACFILHSQNKRKLKQFIIDVNVAKLASGLNNEFFGPSSALLNEANKIALDCYASDFSFTNSRFLSVASLEATKVVFRKFFPSGACFMQLLSTFPTLLSPARWKWQYPTVTESWGWDILSIFSTSQALKGL